MSTLTDKLPKLPTVKLPEVKLPEIKLPDVKIDLDEAKKPAFAAVGVVDVTVEQVKDFPGEAKKVQEKLQAQFEARTASFNTQLKALPTQVKGLRTELQGRVAKAQTEATSFYGDLAVRGEKLVAQIRRQPATETALAEGKAAVKKAQSATASAKKATKAAGTAAEDAAAKIG